KALKAISLALFVSAFSFGQNNSANNGATDESAKIADQVKTLQSAIGAQQKQIAAQQAQMAAQQQQLEMLQKQLDAKTSATATPHVENATLTSVNASSSANPNTPEMQADVEKPKTSPLSVRIGGTEFTPGGFADFNNIFRTTNTGSVVSTGWNAIPFSSSPNGHLTEFRSTGQYSRFNLKVNGKYGDNNITGYIEADFNGNDATNVFATTNPHTFRLRLYYLQAARGSWEITAGQAWTLLTPNKVGAGASPSDLDTTMSTDGNIHVGVMYARQGQFRLRFKPTDHFNWAVSIENPQQSTTTQVVLPAGFAGALGNQADGANVSGVPNLFPDMMTKITFDTNPTGKNLHAEFGGLVTSAQIAVPSPGAPATGPFTKNSDIGGGIFGGLNASISKKFRVLGYGMYGDGVGRYFIAFGPSYVVVPINVSPTTFIADPSMVHSGSGYTGLEYQLGSKTQIGAYYGGIYYQRNAFADVTATTAVKPIIGFGGIGSANSNNRSIQEGSLVINHTLWKNPQFGALLLINDASYATRAPWFVAVNAPKNAHMFMDHLVLRYVLP